MLTKKTKIICTMGPATDDDEVLKRPDAFRNGHCPFKLLSWRS